MYWKCQYSCCDKWSWRKSNSKWRCKVKVGGTRDEKRIKIVLSVFVVMIVLAVVGIYLYQNGYMKYAIEHPRTTEDSLLIKVGNMKRFLNKCKTNALSFMDKAFRYIINLYVICNIGFLQATMRITIFLSVESLV